MKIQILAPEVVDRIAAGEVLDRPANLVKELVENSLDAGADQIDIEFQAGGREVCVADNGRGMKSEDLELSLRRHATSKIVNSEDLFALNSFGFRGEALASIAAVSQLSLTSRTKESDQGYRVISDFGRSSGVQPVSARQGCEVRARDLFANVPARLKFLKSEAAEHGQIKNTLKALALANPDVGFSVRSKEQLLYHWPKTWDWSERARSVLEMDGLFAGEGELNGVRAEVLVSSPQDVANVNRNMWFFAQGRWIQDRSLTAAVMEAYRNLLMHGEYPTVVVRLTLPPEEIDVNVHPTKAQVKFRDPQTVFRVVSRSIRAVLERSPWLENPLNNQSEPVPPAFTLQPTDADAGEVKAATAQATMSFQGRDFERTQYATKSFPLQQVREAVSSAAISSLGQPSFVASTEAQGAVTNQSTAAGTFHWGDLHVIGQLNHTYILAQTQDSFYMVDQHAAHERVMFERLMESFRQGKMDVQSLLLPLVFDFTASEVETLLEHREGLEKLGLNVERMGPESVAVQTIPLLVSEASVGVALRKLAFELSENLGGGAMELAVGEVFASMACHSVIRAGQSMSVEEMKSLLVQMDQYPLSSFCPHGRPVFVIRRFHEIEREFGRIV